MELRANYPSKGEHMKTIIEMAREADPKANLNEPYHVDPETTAWLERFAALVRADEREACAGLAERRMLTDENKNRKTGYDHACKVIASAIRARGNT